VTDPQIREIAIRTILSLSGYTRRTPGYIAKKNQHSVVSTVRYNLIPRDLQTKGCLGNEHLGISLTNIVAGYLAKDNFGPP